MDNLDSNEIYCSPLGHFVPFSYCRKVKDNLFCKNIINCWRSVFDVEDYVKKNWSREEIAAALSPAGPKINSLVELIQKAKRQKTDP